MSANTFPKSAMSPHQFLRELGLKKRPELQLGSSDWAAAVQLAGADPTVIEREDCFAVAFNDVLFADERVARSTLSEDFDRYVEHLHALGKFWNFPHAPPRRIAEIGGGAGVVALYLAQQFPDALIQVFDRAEKPLAIGRKWASDRRIGNIEYIKASYEELANGAYGTHDIALLYNGLSLSADPPNDMSMFSYREVLKNLGVTPVAVMNAGTFAMSRLLEENGTGVVCGGWTPWGAVHFFEALRKSDLGIDWTCSFVGGRCRKDSFDPDYGYAFVRHGLPRLTSDAWEDAQAFFSSGELVSADLAFSIGASEAMSGLFSDGKELIVASVAVGSADGERIRLICKSGLLCLEHSGAPWFRRVCITSLGALRLMIERVQTIANGWMEIPGSKVQCKRDASLVKALSIHDIRISFSASALL